MNTNFTWPWRTSTKAALKREARKPTASVSASTKPYCRNSIRWRSANASTPASSSCRPTSMPGSLGTTNSDHIRGAGATARRQCKPSLTPSHSPGRNHWPPDVGQTQPFRHQTGQLSDQVSASTNQVTARLVNGRWAPGRSGNPGGRPGGVAEVRELARTHTAEAIGCLLKEMRDGDTSHARIAAANALLDRGW